jgi:hypothetical protein
MNWKGDGSCLLRGTVPEGLEKTKKKLSQDSGPARELNRELPKHMPLTVAARSKT